MILEIETTVSVRLSKKPNRGERRTEFTLGEFGTQYAALELKTKVLRVAQSDSDY